MRFDKLWGEDTCKLQTQDLAVKMMMAGEHFWQAWGTYDGKSHTWIIDHNGRYIDPSQWDTSAEHYWVNRIMEYGGR